MGQKMGGEEWVLRGGPPCVLVCELSLDVLFKDLVECAFICLSMGVRQVSSVEWLSLDGCDG